MTIRSQVALAFTLITTVLMVAMCVYVYTAFSSMRKRQFQERVNERALITGMIYLEEDEMSASIFEQIRRQYFQVLPEEKEWIGEFCALDEIPFDSVLLSDFNTDFLERIYNENEAHFNKNNTFYSGIFYPDNQGDYIIIVSATDQYGARRENELVRIILTGLIISLLMVYFFGWYFSKALLKPLRDIVQRLNAIRVYNLHERLPVGIGGKNEISLLSKNINKLLDRLETAFEMQSNFISNASHELNNPLTAIIGETEVILSKEREAKSYKDSLHRISDEAYRLQELTLSLLRLAQARSGKEGFVIESIQLDDLIRDVIEEVKTSRIHAQIEFINNLSDSDFSGSYDLLKIAIQNVVENACKFSSDEPVVISLYQSADTYSIEVVDSGPGIPQKEIGKIFEPFYRADNVRMFEGSGIGLSLVKHILDFHKGDIQITNGKGNKGTIIKIIFYKHLV